MTVLAAIDDIERSTTVVEIAHDLAEAYDDTLVALHVVPEAEFQEHRESIRQIPEFEDYSIEQEQGSAAEFATKFVRNVVDDLDQNRFEARGRIGDVTDEILAEADRLDPRYLVISGRRRSPTGKAVFGNTTQQILLNAECPVVTRLES
ncbi:universal stress protein [Halovivax gelatinilyticus]|uniref:universal stress protein n=1 Tax=Halovivax gelatinilyticus TaxID=2961597 RepID=UPI0020CA84E5|nr:universal stress protein [Halovivax gelatinilyticus]